ncbi:DUF2746 domain-containing protein [Streptomyces sp. ID05-39B]|uniref:DUF2746 domain-containing protein n=1 Tax=Streptomyces sp. ID05-39B TaxID=3028664 RepID=UPI0029A14921|nr:DUF2746 domain-containing protein [Streptomyces sp. ID05-39B]MDX3525066.1 DUF2746 domain-containing protein [Streptomyces sp. ID05-39B]
MTVGGTILVTLLGIGAELMRRQMKAIGEVADNAQEARDQVSNTHSTNLRDDLDAVASRIDRVLALQEMHSTEIAGLRADIAHERRERLAVAERLDDHVAATAA